MIVWWLDLQLPMQSIMQNLSPLKLWVWIPLRRCVLDITLCDKVCQWLATGRWFSLGTLVSSNNKTDRHNITEILLKVALKTITLTLEVMGPKIGARFKLPVVLMVNTVGSTHVYLLKDIPKNAPAVHSPIILPYSLQTLPMHYVSNIEQYLHVKIWMAFLYHISFILLREDISKFIYKDKHTIKTTWSMTA